MLNTNMEPFHYFCQKVLPAVYDDSLSYYELLCKVTDKLNELIETYNLSSGVIAELQKQLEALKAYIEGQPFQEQIAEAVTKWVYANLDYIFGNVVKQVFFGLTSDGRFCAYVPKSWSDIKFDTGVVYGTENYGRLILKYDATGTGIIDNTAYDGSVLTDTIDTRLKAIAGKGLSYDADSAKMDIDYGNGLKVDSATNKLEVPLGAGLKYASDGSIGLA